ncbi:putative autophagy-related protein 11 [Zophobas morio]|uniref:putative autophagy-related protein 11 n=1 Tax=Zophobas morio TaxID=2755281 RepID=UPI00308305A8
MEKTLSFSIFKEKIIKTNELLCVLLEKNKSLDKSQKLIQQLKKKLELNRNEVNKLKLRNETLTCDLTAVEKDYNLLSTEHIILKDRFKQLENESNNTINNLQVNYQLANQELKQCKEKLTMLEEFNDELETVPFKNLKSPTKRRRVPFRKKRSPQKKEGIVLHDVVAMCKEIDELKIERQKLITEKTDFQLEVYELKRKLTDFESVTQDENNPLKMKEELAELRKNIEEKDKELERLSNKIKKIENQKETLQSDNERLKIENSLCQEEISTLQSKCLQNDKQSAITKTKNKELNKLSAEFKQLQLERSRLHDENQKLKIENNFFQLEISCLQNKSEKTSGNPCTQEEQHDSPVLDDGSPTLNEESLEPINDCRRESNSTPTNEEVSAIMKNMVVPDKLSPLIEQPRHNDQGLSSHEDHINRSPSPHADLRHNNQESSPARRELFQRNITRKRNYLTKRRQLARKKAKQVDLYGALLALKKANINFVISSNSFESPNRSSSRLINFECDKNIKFKNFEKKKPVTITKELTCLLVNCKSTYMVLKGCKDDEDAPLLGFVGVKNESLVSQNNNLTVTRPLESHISATKRDTTKKSCSIEKNSDDVPRNNEQVVQIIEADDEDIYVKNTEKRNDRNNKKEKTSLQNNKIVHNCSNNETEDPLSHNEEDENTEMSSLNTKRKPPNQPELRRSKRKRNSLMSMLKKRRTGTVNKLAITKCTASCLDVEEKEEKLENAIKNRANSSDSVPVQDFVFKKPTTRPKSFKRPLCNKKRSLQPPVINEQCDTNDSGVNLEEEKTEDSIAPMETSPEKLPKTTFKRPVCSTRSSRRLSMVSPECDKSNDNPKIQEVNREENIDLESPKSPTPESQPPPANKPVLIPLEKKVPEFEEKIPSSKIEMLFSKLILYTKEEEVLNEVVREFSSQDPEYIAQAVLERIALDYHDNPDTKHSPAPLMTEVQRTMLGFMSKLEKTSVIGVFDSYLTLSEQRLLTCNKLEEFGPVTRLYLAICKLHKNITRMRKLCCDVFYFCGDLAIPFLFIVLTSWPEVIPYAADAKDFPLARVLVQIVYTTDCKKPGYNHMPLRDMLIKFYGYPKDRWEYDDFFKELFNGYLKNPSRSSDFALLLYCKSRPEKWVYEKVDEHLKPLVSMEIQDNFKATLIILIGNLYNRFSSKSEVNYLPQIREWLSSLVKEDTPDVVRKCVYVSLSRLKKK